MTIKQWCIKIIISYVTIMVSVAVIVYITDPYFHFHKPYKGIYYDINYPEYQNDGIARNFDYTGIISGTSLTRNFSTQEAEQLFGASFVRLTYQGEGFKIINDNLKVALSNNPNIDIVIRGLDPMWFNSDANYLASSEYPDYLYDNNLFTDVNYIYNKTIFCNSVVPEIYDTFKGSSPKSFDDHISHNDHVGAANILKSYHREPTQNILLSAEENEQRFETLQENIEKNVLSTIESNPNVTFYIFFPPYSILYWDEAHQMGDAILNRRIDMEEYVIKLLLPYQNVKLFSFNNDFDLVCNLDHYVDTVHYTSDINTQILVYLKEGTGQITSGNYQEYISQIRTFYTNYNYDNIYN